MKSYSARVKQDALRRLAANNGSAKLTHDETGIPASTLHNWWKAHQALSDADKLNELRQQLIIEAMEMASHLRQTVGDVPFSHRATALNQMIDKILKITELLEGNGEKPESKVVVLEYGDDEDQVQKNAWETETDSGQ